MLSVGLPRGYACVTSGAANTSHPSPKCTLTIFSKCSLMAPSHRDIGFLRSAAGTSLPITFPCSAAGQGWKQQQGCTAGLNRISPRMLTTGISFVVLNLIKGKCKLSCVLRPTAYCVLFTQLDVLHRQLPSSASASSGAKTGTFFHINAEIDLV